MIYQQVGFSVHDDLPEQLSDTPEFSQFAFHFTLGGTDFPYFKQLFRHGSINGIEAFTYQDANRLCSVYRFQLEKILIAAFKES